MSRELLILRHAKSSWESDAATDFDRPLGPRGEQDAPRMGEWMKSKRLKPDRVISSPAKRAAQTAVAACRAVGFDERLIQWDRRVYAASQSELLRVVKEVSDGSRVLLVGHNPGLEDLLDYLCGSSVALPEDGKLLPTATLARLELPDDWMTLAHGCARNLSITRPKELS